MSLNVLQLWLQYKGDELTLLQKVVCCITCQYAMNIGAFHCIFVLAAVQKICSSFVQNLCFFRIVLLVKLVSIFEFSPVFEYCQLSV